MTEIEATAADYGLEIVAKESYKTDGINNPDNAGMITDGTPILIDMSNDAGILPTNNFQAGTFGP